MAKTFGAIRTLLRKDDPSCLMTGHSKFGCGGGKNRLNANMHCMSDIISAQDMGITPKSGIHCLGGG